MRRIFKMERLNQIQQKFGVDINDFKNPRSAQQSLDIAQSLNFSPETIAGLRQGLSQDKLQAGFDPIYKSQLQAASSPSRALTPTKFMDAFEL